MANFVKGAKKAAAARKGHQRTTKSKSHRGVRVAAWAKHGTNGRSKSKRS